ncbi:MAG: methyltransferase domain-containing protein [Motiliproteus sp.]
MKAQQAGLNTAPRSVAELGPGDSLGLGLAALLSGCDRYLAFDVVRHTDLRQNVGVFDELVALFQAKTAIPDDEEFAEVKPRLDDYRFPAEILTDARLAASLAPQRLQAIRAQLQGHADATALISYQVPWGDVEERNQHSVDMIFSQAVLEHVDDLDAAYRAMAVWIRPGGYLSHQIDLKSHGTATCWNGHWRYSDFIWGLVRGKRTYLLNRMPLSVHVELVRSHGFDQVFQEVFRQPSGIQRAQLATTFSHLTDDDLTASGVFFQAVPRV